MNKFFGKAGLVVLAGAFVSLATVSCKKEAPTVAKILVVDTSGAPVPNAMVRLYPDPTIDVHGAIVIDDTNFTDVTGYANFDFSEHFNLGQAGVFVLDIEVRLEDSLSGTGIIKVEEELTTEEKVIIQ